MHVEKYVTININAEDLKKQIRKKKMRKVRQRQNEEEDVIVLR